MSENKEIDIMSESQLETIAEYLQTIANNPTDKTLEKQNMPADAKAAGALKKITAALLAAMAITDGSFTIDETDSDLEEIKNTLLQINASLCYLSTLKERLSLPENGGLQLVKGNNLDINENKLDNAYFV